MPFRRRTPEVAVMIRWFTDEDRERMREEERMSRLYQAFLWEYTLRNARVVDRGQQVSPGLMKFLDHGLSLDGMPEPPSRRWKHHPRYDA
jgi:hypothetical protein